MSLISIRKKSLTIDTIRQDMGRVLDTPLRMAAASAVVKNPYAGHYVEDLLPFMAELRSLGTELANEIIDALGGKEHIEVYGKAAIVGVNGEIEHAAVWHEAGGWAMREVLGRPRALVPANKAVAAAGYRLMVPVHYIHACYVRSHFNSMEIGIQDAPRPDEILVALVMGTGGRPNARVGGLLKQSVIGEDGQR